MAHDPTNRSAFAGPLFLTVVTGLMALSGCGPAAGTSPDEANPQGDEHSAEVHIDEVQRQSAGIETTVAAAAPIEETMHLVARVASNEDRIFHVTPPIPGIVQAIHKGLGDAVKAGDPLVEIWSVELGNATSSWLKARASVSAAEETLAKSKQLFAQRLETLTSVLDGEIRVARKIYEREDELQQKAIATIRPFLEADKELQRALLAKDRELTTLAAERDTRLLDLEVVLREARIEEVAARERLRALGLEDAAIETLAEPGQRHGSLVLRAPGDGVVLERHVTRNEHVGTEDALFVIHDLSTVWVLASAYEKDLARLRPRQKAYVHVDALPGADLTGEVSLIDYRIATATRTSAVRIVLPNSPLEGWPIDLPLRPGMFGEVEIVVESRTGRVVLPEAAIVHEGEDNFVFVQTPGEDGSYQRRPVQVRAGAHNLVEIVAGVDPAETVVVAGTFALKSLARSEELGEGDEH